MKLYYPPTIPLFPGEWSEAIAAYIPQSTQHPSIFLAGSIEMNRADDWQAAFIANFVKQDISIFNPRRLDWDANITQSIDDPRFREQVEWELEMLQRCSTIVMYLQPGTISPISLMELGLFAAKGNLVVCCPEGFHRKGNVDFICEVFSIPTVDKFDDLAPFVLDLLKEGKL